MSLTLVSMSDKSARFTMPDRGEMSLSGFWRSASEVRLTMPPSDEMSLILLS